MVPLLLKISAASFYSIESLMLIAHLCVCGKKNFELGIYTNFIIYKRKTTEKLNKNYSLINILKQ
jgi:hypothetical protein